MLSFDFLLAVKWATIGFIAAAAVQASYLWIAGDPFDWFQVGHYVAGCFVAAGCVGADS